MRNPGESRVDIGELALGTGLMRPPCSIAKVINSSG
jgi:hypothetical protein